MPHLGLYNRVCPPPANKFLCRYPSQGRRVRFAPTGSDLPSNKTLTSGLPAATVRALRCRVSCLPSNQFPKLPYQIPVYLYIFQRVLMPKYSLKYFALRFLNPVTAQGF
jgi:hypothetical protein